MQGLGLVLAGFVGVGWGQGSGSLAGTVVDATNGAPIAGVVLVLDYQKAKTTTDEAGGFRFEQVEAGDHFVTAERDGYVKELGRWAGAIRTGKGEVVRGMRLQLEPEAVLSGRVLDAAGKPVSASVTVTRGTSAVWAGGAMATAGGYEVRGLPAGEYRVAAQRGALGSGSDLFTYHPSTVSADGAELLRLGAGERRQGVDVVLRNGPLVAVAGRYLGSVPELERLTVSVQRGDGQPLGAVGSGMIDREGRFQLKMPPGEYGLQVVALPGPSRQPVIHGKATVTVFADQRMNDVVIQPQPLYTLRATIRWADGRRLSPGTSRFMLNPLSGQGMLQFGRSESDGALVATEVSEGVYSATVGGLPYDAYVKSVLAGEKDVTREGLKLGGGVAPELTFLLDNKGGVVAGTLVDENGRPAVGGYFSAMPANATTTEIELWSRRVCADAQGRFVATGLAPGEYDVQATMGRRSTDSRRVTVRPGGRTDVRLAFQ